MRPRRRPPMKAKQKQTFAPKIFLAKIGKGRTLKDHQQNQMIFSQGDPADAIFYIQKGKVKLTVVSPQGKEAVVAILGAGDFFGEGSLAGQLVRMATATAMPECAVRTKPQTADASRGNIWQGNCHAVDKQLCRDYACSNLSS